MLGVAVNRKQLFFPVGKVDIKTMYPMDMEEFLLTLGEDALVKEIHKYFEDDTPMPSARVINVIISPISDSWWNA